MTKVTHPSMRRVKDSSIPRPESYVVDDANEYEDYNQETEPVYLVDPPKSTEPNHNKKMLEDLLFLGKATQDVNLSGHVFVLSTLTHREHNNLMKELYKFGNGADLFTLRTLTLVFALKSVDGVKLEDISSEDSSLNVFDKKMSIIDSMQMNVITKLYECYDELAGRVDKSIKEQEIKN